VHERLDVLGALAQGGNPDGHDVQAVEEVLPEAPRLRLGREVAVRRRDEADVDVLGPAADLLHVARLKRPEDLGLNREREVADLVDEQRPLVGLLEVALTRGLRAGEGALRVAEELGLRELARNRRGVEADEGLSARRECAWTAVATTSLPAPLSPVKSTVTSFGATRATMSRTRRIAGLSAMIVRPSAASARKPRVLQAKRAHLDRARTTRTSSSGSKGFGR
jgi:hypothetical protein